MHLSDRWHQTWSYFEEAPPSGLLEELIGAYSEPHRAYHTSAHLCECFTQLDGSQPSSPDLGLVELAIWFHDAVYDTRASDNEEQSAAWAQSALACLGARRSGRIGELILVTRHDAAPGDAGEMLILDVDLSILGAERTRFDEYEAQIRTEYDWVPEEAYRGARSKVLGEFLARPVLYHTEFFRQSLEARARENLRRSLDTLAA